MKKPSSPDVYHRNFPRDGRPWRVEWIGQIIHQPGGTPTALAEIIISPLSDGGPSNAIQRPVDPEQRRIIHLEVGYLGEAPIGSIWQDGHRLPYPAYATLEVSACSFTRKHAYSYELNEFTPDPGGATLLDSVLPNYDPDKHGPAHHSRILLVKAAHPTIDVLIPMSAVASFFYFRSAQTARLLATTPLEEAISQIYDAKNSHFDSQNEVVRIVPLKGTRVADLPLVASLITSDFAREGAQRIHEKLTLHRLRNNYAALELFPPFGGPVEMHLKGDYVMVGEVHVFLAYRIIASEFPLPPGVSRIEYESPFENTDAGTHKAHTKVPTETGNDLSSIEHTLASISGMTPTHQHSELSATILSAPEIERVEHDRKRYCDPETRAIHKHTVDGFSAAPGISSGSTKAPHEVSTPAHDRKEQSHEEIDNFKAFERLSETLGTVEGISVIPLGVGSHTVKVPNRILSCFPFIEGRSIRWPIIDPSVGARRNRYLMAVEIGIRGAKFHLLEMEQREGERRCSILLLWKEDLQSISRDEWDHFLEKCVLQKSWPTDGALNGLRFLHKRFKHSSTSDGRATRITRAVKENAT